MTSQRVIRNYMVIAGLYTLSASVIWGVNTLFLLDAGLDIFGVFIANAAFTAGMVLFEIPTGVLADTVGRRASFLLSTAVLGAGTLAYVLMAQIDAGLVWFSIVSVFLGLGFTFYSGAVEAWLVDALAATDYKGELDRVFARGSMVTGVAMLIGTVGGGILGSLDLAVPFIARSVLLAALFVVATRTMRDIGFTPRALTLATLPSEMMTVAKASVTFGWRQRPVKLLMIVSFLQSGFLMWGFYAWQPYFLELLGRDAVWVAGVVAALISLSTIAGNGIVEWFTRFCGTRTTLLIWAAAVQAVATIGIGLVNDFWFAVGLLLVVTTAMGAMMPVKQAYLHQIIPSAQRATVVSFDSMIGSAGGVGGQLGLGYLSRARSIASGYVTGGIAMLLVPPVLFALRRLKDPADVIVAEAGCKTASGVQGLPEVSGIDTTKRQPVEIG